MKHPICIWPDNTWCELSEIEEYTFMSDDYAIVDAYKYEDIDAFVINYNTWPSDNHPTCDIPFN